MEEKSSERLTSLEVWSPSLNQLEPELRFRFSQKLQMDKDEPSQKLKIDSGENASKAN